jgi:hypothetical protein
MASANGSFKSAILELPSGIPGYWSYRNMVGLTSASASPNRIGARVLLPKWHPHVRAAFDEFCVGQLGAFVHLKNLASIRVLEKVGFRAERRDVVMGMESIVFSLGANVREGLP